MLALADVELCLERRQRVRRALVAATALAGLLCWTAAQLPQLALVQAAAPPLFAICLLASTAAFAAERRMSVLHRALVAQLPAQTRRFVSAA